VQWKLAFNCRVTTETRRNIEDEFANDKKIKKHKKEKKKRNQNKKKKKKEIRQFRRLEEKNIKMKEKK